jgi:hypothetical protein
MAGPGVPEGAVARQIGRPATSRRTPAKGVRTVEGARPGALVGRIRNGGVGANAGAVAVIRASARAVGSVASRTRPTPATPRRG